MRRRRKPRLAERLMVFVAATIGSSVVLAIRSHDPFTAVIPLVLIALVGSSILLIEAVRIRRLRPTWACRKCGYDRRGLDRRAVCPECGHPPR